MKNTSKLFCSLLIMLLAGFNLYAAPPCTVLPIVGASQTCLSTPVTLADPTPGGTWSSSAPSIASIGATTGALIGGAPGIVTITYTVSLGCSTSITFTVTPTPAAITGTNQLCLGDTSLLGETVPGGTWYSDNPAVVSVSSTGIITAGIPGITNINYSLGGCVVSKSIILSLLMSPITGTPEVCTYGLTTLSQFLSTSGGYWTSNNTAVATIGLSSGVVTGITAGVATIRFTLSPGCTVSQVVTVNPAPAPITGISHVCVGSTTTLGDASPGGIWNSTNPALASCSGSGVVTGVANGTDTIEYIYPATGCKTILPINVIDLPAITGRDSICAWGDTLTVTNSYPGGVYTSSMVTVMNLGGGVGRVTSAVPGIATVVYTIPAGCSVSKTITVNALPNTITGLFNVCLGFTSLLSDITPGGVWSTASGSIATIGSSSGVVTGTGVGNTHVFYTLPTGCKADTVVHVSPPPSPITGTAVFCVGSSTTLSDSSTGGTWTSSNPSTAYIVGGTSIVTGLNAGVVSITYSLGGTCITSTTVTVNAQPNIFVVSGGGGYCAGGTGVHVYLSGSQTGVNYQLYNGGTPVDTPMHGTGFSIDFGLITGAGIYTVVATNTTTTCSANMTGTAIINANPLPTSFAITGGGGFCAGGTGAHIGLASSNAGVNYQLFYGSTPFGGPVTGLGGPVDFGLFTGVGTYTVRATNPVTGCNDTMAGSVTLTSIPPVTPGVSLVSTVGDTICLGVNATYITTEVNGGTTPVYQWKVNGTNVGTGGSTYSYIPANNDVVSVVMTSNATCASPATATNSLTMTVNNLLVPVVSIAASPGTIIYVGQTDTFTAIVSNGGPSPTYQWQINGSPITGATNVTYVDLSPSNGDVITCVVKSSGQCGNQTGSGHLTLTVNPNVGFSNTVSAGDVVVMPNPNKGSFIIKGKSGVTGKNELLVEIMNVLGQVVYKNELSIMNGEINELIQMPENTANGMYLLHINTGSMQRVFHIIVQQ